MIQCEPKIEDFLKYPPKKNLYLQFEKTYSEFILNDPNISFIHSTVYYIFLVLRLSSHWAISLIDGTKAKSGKRKFPSTCISMVSSLINGMKNFSNDFYPMAIAYSVCYGKFMGEKYICMTGLLLVKPSICGCNKLCFAVSNTIFHLFRILFYVCFCIIQMGGSPFLSYHSKGWLTLAPVSYQTQFP